VQPYRIYDSAGNLQTVTHFDGVQTTYTYDPLNRLLSRTTQGAPVSFTYTVTGKRHTMIDASGTTTYGYNSSDQLTTTPLRSPSISYCIR
jgi:YD repeat-containing protein